MHSEVVGGSLPSVLALAFLGDARHSLYVRKMLVMRGISKSGALSEAAKEYVCAEAQARMLEKVEHLLLPDELAVCRRARNSTHLNPPKRAGKEDYRAATAFEALIGMLEWIKDEERLLLILDTAHGKEDEND